jgi:parallel beta-helix repeat protein
MARFKSLMFLATLVAQVPLSLATVTYQVGGCLPKLASFTTISQALQASPSPNLVKVCPGSYNEQVIITHPVTLEGVSVGGSSQVAIGIPTTGLTTTTDDLGDILAPQVWVESSGEVNLNNLTVVGDNNDISSPYLNLVGVLYKSTSGKVSDLSLIDQNTAPTSGVNHGTGIWLEGGSSNPSVAIEDSFILGSDYAGIMMESVSSTLALSATLSGNSVDGTYSTSSGGTSYGLYGIVFGFGTSASVSGNFTTGNSTGIYIYPGAEGSASKNTIQGNGYTQYGIDIEGDDASVTSNTIREGFFGILVDSAIAPVTGNTIIGSGIDFNCIAGNNVHSNTIFDSDLGLYEVPAAVPTNTYHNVAALYTGGC